MEQINLAARLAQLAALVPAGARLADVGTDHGWLPISLLESGRISYAYATDIRPGPLARAAAHAAERHTLHMECLLCDGLQGVPPHGADCIVIAGMGGDSISDILLAAPWTREETRLILQPMSKAEVLRRNLAALGLRTLEEHLVIDNHRLYPILVCEGGAPDIYNEAQYYTGIPDLNRTPVLFRQMIHKTREQLCKALEGIMRSSQPNKDIRCAELNIILQQLAEMEDA